MTKSSTVTMSSKILFSIGKRPRPTGKISNISVINDIGNIYGISDIGTIIDVSSANISNISTRSSLRPQRPKCPQCPQRLECLECLSARHFRRRYYFSNAPLSTLSTFTPLSTFASLVPLSPFTPLVHPSYRQNTNYVREHEQFGLQLKSVSLRHSSSSNSSTSSGSSSNSSNSSNGPSSSEASEASTELNPSSKPKPRTKRKKRNIRKKSPHSFTSPIQKATIEKHPKTTSSNHNAHHPNDIPVILTKRQILQMTPRQQTSYKHQKSLQNRPSTLDKGLDQVRKNVRSNLNYLGNTVDGNLKRNVETLRRMWRGEEVWNDPDPVDPVDSAGSQSKGTKGTKGQQSKGTKERHGKDGKIESDEIDWEKLPSVIQANVLSNLSIAQNLLHRWSNGAIPRSNYGSGARGGRGGRGVNESMVKATILDNTSIAKVQTFHRQKQYNPIPMDTKWFWVNILLALTPGACIGLFCKWMEPEVKEFFEELERREREARLGGLIGDGVGGGRGAAGRRAAHSKSVEESVDGGNVEEGTMGLSTALTMQGGSPWDKIKNAVNDLFLGGIHGLEHGANPQSEQSDPSDQSEQLVKEKKSEQQQHHRQKQPQHHQQRDVPHASQSANNASNASNASNAPVNKEDITVQMLLRRIQALEKQLEHTQSQGTHATNEDANDTSNVSNASDAANDANVIHPLAEEPSTQSTQSTQTQNEKEVELIHRKLNRLRQTQLDLSSEQNEQNGREKQKKNKQIGEKEEKGESKPADNEQKGKEQEQSNEGQSLRRILDTPYNFTDFWKAYLFLLEQDFEDGKEWVMHCVEKARDGVMGMMDDVKGMMDGGKSSKRSKEDVLSDKRKEAAPTDIDGKDGGVASTSDRSEASMSSAEILSKDSFDSGTDATNRPTRSTETTPLFDADAAINVSSCGTSDADNIQVAQVTEDMEDTTGNNGTWWQRSKQFTVNLWRRIVRGRADGNSTKGDGEEKHSKEDDN